MEIKNDDIDYCKTVNIQGMLIGIPNYDFNYVLKNYEINFIPDICIVRSFSLDLILASIFSYTWSGGILLWSNLTNNYIAGLVPLNNGSNIGVANTVNNNNCTVKPNSIIFLKHEIPNILKFRMAFSNNSSAKPFDNYFNTTNGYFQLTLDFIKFKAPKLLK